MKHRSIAASLTLAACLLASPSFAAGPSGIIHFSGTIVEPPCEFDVGPANLQPACPRPASGNVAFVDAATQQPIRTVAFTQASASIDLPNRPPGRHAPMIAVITYK
ncbi:type 1 fimbrial protein [Burkholderia guangdongensis]|uniref:type 1 fimbrial protein n=1 Tax=Burkholderia guangdongensis TaxID=1792500 RepID=UPI0015CA84DA|nr:type 1 fimbrial protein [Burkholderia guangdongensis]